MSEKIGKHASIDNIQCLGIHSNIAFIVLVIIVVVIVILFPRFGIAGKCAQSSVPKASLALETSPEPNSSIEPTADAHASTSIQSASPSTAGKTLSQVKTNLVIDGNTFAVLAIRQAAEEPISNTVAYSSSSV